MKDLIRNNKHKLPCNLQNTHKIRKNLAKKEPKKDLS